MTRLRQGDIDGVALDGFAVGLTYDVNPDLATYLISTASAELVMEDDVNADAERETRHAVNVQHWHEVAADLGRRKDRESS